MSQTATPVVLYWHRTDLRLGDNPALRAAITMGNVQPVFILDTTDHGTWGYGGASKWWLHHSLASLQESYQKLGVTLLLQSGDPEKLLPKLAKTLNATHIVWNRRYEPAHIKQDSAIKKQLSDDGLTVDSFNGNLLAEPWTIQTKSKTPFKVFTPFWRTLSESSPAFDPLTPHPRKMTAPSHAINSDTLADWGLLPTQPNWAKSFEPVWEIGEQAAQKRLDYFLSDAAGHYKTERDFPAKDGTSRMSPHLAFGEISPRQIWYAAQDAITQHASNPAYRAQVDAFVRQIGWREFSYHLLYHFPTTPTEPLYEQFKDFPWSYHKKHWAAWTTGQTGYPIVDAGMRQLWQTGWLHNRVRLIVASFLIKDLHISWQDGSEWFWDTLVDADLANNTMGWQWTAGCGADASPYYRIFNPMLQSAKFDPTAAYIREFVPELANLPDKYIHAPWDAPDDVLTEAGVTLGKTYPKPIVDHFAERDKALALLKEFKSK